MGLRAARHARVQLALGAQRAERHLPHAGVGVDPPQRSARHVRHASQSFHVFLEGDVVLVCRIVLDHGNDSARPHEAGQVVDVPVRVVADDATPQPQHLVNA